ncbi:MAG: pyruvate dehydrogenase complex dihydrolipoamide acetyltransferase, partial [Cucumibacter sp.]
KEGDTVSSGDVIAEIETDKATMEVEAVDEGKIGKIVVPEGTENVAVNSVIAILLQEGETATDAKPPEAAAKPAVSPAKPAPQAPKPVAATPEAKPIAAPAAVPRLNGATRIFASPLARRLAAESKIDLAALTGSGPHGRIVKRDIDKSLKDGVPSSASGAPALAKGMSRAEVMALYPEGSYELVPNDGMRRIVAQRLSEAKQTIPHFYLTLDCRIDALMQAREEINASAHKGEDGKPAFRISVNDFVIKGWAMALHNVPKANATWAGDAILYHQHSDIGVAVAVPGGLFTPVVHQADAKPLRQISEEMKDYATRARTRRLAPHEYQGGTSAVSNLGMYGIKHFAAVINPPHGTLLAVGAGEERPYAEKGEVKIGQFMAATLSCDHRSVDGALGAEVLAEFKKIIENPVLMLA